MTIVEDDNSPNAAAEAASGAMTAELLMLGKVTRALMGLKLAAIGLHSGQDELLVSLHERQPQSVSFLADVLGVRPSTVSKMLDRLMERGLVARTGDASDARRTLVALTPEGVSMLERIRDVHSSLDADLAHDLYPGDPTADDIRRLHSSMAKRLRRLR